MTESTIPPMVKTELKTRYAEILRKNKVTEEFTELEVTAPLLQGENFASSCDYLTVHQENGEKIHIFVKRLLDNPIQTAIVKDLRLFEKEAGFFNQIVPAITKFVAARNPDYVLDMIPKCVFANEEFVMMENLTLKGYELLDKIERQSFEETSVAMKSLAKFHASSYLLIEEEGVQNFFSRFDCLEDILFIKTAQKHVDGWFEPTLKITTSFLKMMKNCEEKTYALDMLSKLMATVTNDVQKCYSHEDGHLCFVVNHGDCWNNNMLFQKDKKDNSILHHVLLDFQVTRVASPNMDLSHFMFTSVKAEVYQREWKNLLKIYYDAFKQHVTSLKGTVNFSFEDLVKDYKRKFFPGFIHGIINKTLVDAAAGMGDLNEIESDVTTNLLQMTEKWMKNYPEKATEGAKVLCGMFQEFKQLTDDN